MAGLKKVAVVAGFTAGLGLVLPGCADNESSMFIVGVMTLEDSECVLDPNPQGAFLGSGVLDLEIRDSYTAPILVGNQVTERGSRNQLRTETSRVRLEGAEITLEDIAGNSLASFTSLGSGFANPAAGTDPGYGGMFADIVPTGSGISDGQYVAAIKAFGTTLGGQSLTSAELRFPLEVCTGCLITYPGAAQDRNAPAGSAYECAATSADALDEKGALGTLPCFPGQDHSVSCLYCSAYDDVCRDPTQNPSFGG